MNTTKSSKKIWFALLFGIYMITMTWIILFKMETSLSFDGLYRDRSLNLIPFFGLLRGRITSTDIIGNIIIFIPFGIYISAFKHRNFIKKVFICLLLTLFYEIFQFIFSIGVTDITDVILNTFGGILGIGIFYIIKKICQTPNKTQKVITAFATATTIPMVILLTMITLLN